MSLKNKNICEVLMSLFRCLVEASSDNSSPTCGCVPFPPSQVAEANVASNERAKRSKKKKKNEGWTREGSFGFHSLPYLSIFSLHLFPSFCLLPFALSGSLSQDS